MSLVEKFKGLVFSQNKIGKLKTPPIHLEYDQTFQPIQPMFRNVPIHYQPQVSELLEFLCNEGVVTDVDPRKSYDCVMNVVITDKWNGNIHMNIDNTPMNAGMKQTKFHEIRHELKKAKIFSEMDMGWGYHQIEIDEESKDKAIFQRAPSHGTPLFWSNSIDWHLSQQNP